MINSLFFIFFYFLCFYIGRGIVIIFEFVLKQKFLEYKFFGIPLYIFYPIIYLFFVGNVVMIANFFTKGFNIIVFIISTVPLVFNLFQKNQYTVAIILAGMMCVPAALGAWGNLIFWSYVMLYQLVWKLFVRSRNDQIFFEAELHRNPFFSDFRKSFWNWTMINLIEVFGII